MVMGPSLHPDEYAFSFETSVDLPENDQAGSLTWGRPGLAGTEEGRVLESDLARCINQMVSKSQPPHKTVNLLF